MKPEDERGALLRRILSKILLPQDRHRIERYSDWRLDRTYAGRNQLAAGAWSSVLRSDSSLGMFGIYGPATLLAKYSLIIIDPGSPYFDNPSLYGVNSCKDCPHWRGPRDNKNCRLDRPKECPFCGE